MVTLLCCPTARLGYWRHDSISYLVASSWYSALQWSSYSSNGECEATYYVATRINFVNHRFDSNFQPSTQKAYAVSIQTLRFVNVGCKARWSQRFTKSINVANLSSTLALLWRRQGQSNVRYGVTGGLSIVVQLYKVAHYQKSIIDTDILEAKTPKSHWPKAQFCKYYHCDWNCVVIATEIVNCHSNQNSELA